mgnify:FL=1
MVTFYEPPKHYFLHVVLPTTLNLLTTLETKQNEFEHQQKMYQNNQASDSSAALIHQPNILAQMSVEIVSLKSRFVEYFVNLQKELERSMFSFTGGGIPPIFQASADELSSVLNLEEDGIEFVEIDLKKDHVVEIE